MTVNKIERDEALRMAERLEFNSLNHLNWAWSVEHRDAAALIRRLAGLPPAKPAPTPTPTKIDRAPFAKPIVTTRGKK